MDQVRNPADERRRIRAEIEARTAAGRPAKTAGSDAGLGIIVAVAIVFGGLIPLVAAFLRPLGPILEGMGPFAPVGLLLLGGAVAATVARRIRRSRARGLVTLPGAPRR
jgi:VIT1/CCC1 family predicted Fe2+/Mn2+ transporter